MRNEIYKILDENHNLIDASLIEWGMFFESADRIVRADYIKGEVKISTVFLGLDHSFGGRSLWFETMIFGGPLDGYQKRYETWDEAVHGHGIALQKALEENAKEVELKSPRTPRGDE